MKEVGVGEPVCGQIYLDSMIEKYTMHSFSDSLNTSEGEGQVGQTSTHPGSR